MQKPPEQPVGAAGFSVTIGLTTSEAAPDCAVWLTPLDASKSWHVGPAEKKVLQARESMCR